MLNSFDSVAQYRAIRVGVNVDFIKVFRYKKVLLLNLLFLLNGILVTPISANLLLKRSTLSILMMYDL
jgi:hypothetical protein